jgi:DNA-binding beta-propeller fold protein YncE
MEKQFHWALALTHDGQTLYAVNASLGTVAVMAAGDLPKIVRSAPVALGHSDNLVAGLITRADAKGPRIGGAALSPDGGTLYSFAATGVVAIDTKTLKVRTRYLDPWQPDTMRMSSDGKWLYVAESSESKLWQIDPLNGSVTELKAPTNPWALLWAQPQ